jgi:hypothetical protein
MGRPLPVTIRMYVPAEFLPSVGSWTAACGDIYILCISMEGKGQGGQKKQEGRRGRDEREKLPLAGPGPTTARALWMEVRMKRADLRSIVER